MDWARAAGALYPDWRPGESQSGAVEQYSHGHNTAATLHASLAITTWQLELQTKVRKVSQSRRRPLLGPSPS